MKKNSRIAAAQKTKELEPFDRRKLDPSRFKTDLTAGAWKESLTTFPLGPIGENFPLYWFTVDTLSATKTVGKGRTNLTLIRPTILQTDATAPYAGFDRTVSPDRKPAVQVHFNPAAYGFTSVATYHLTFAIEAGANTTFQLAGFAGSGTVANAGARTVSGRTRLTLILRNVAPNDIVYGYLEQTGGANWSWYSTEIHYPPLLIQI